MHCSRPFHTRGSSIHDLGIRGRPGNNSLWNDSPPGYCFLVFTSASKMHLCCFSPKVSPPSCCPHRHNPSSPSSVLSPMHSHAQAYTSAIITWEQEENGRIGFRVRVTRIHILRHRIPYVVFIGKMGKSNTISQYNRKD